MRAKETRKKLSADFVGHRKRVVGQRWLKQYCYKYYIV